MYLSNSCAKKKKWEKREDEAGERSFQRESFSATARAEIGVAVTPGPNFVLPFGGWTKKENSAEKGCGCEGRGAGLKMTPSFVITVLSVSFFYALR